MYQFIVLEKRDSKMKKFSIVIAGGGSTYIARNYFNVVRQLRSFTIKKYQII